MEELTWLLGILDFCISFLGTPLLPPGLEHFNTPQMVELAADSRSQSPARDDKSKPASKKKQEGVLPDKRELSKVSNTTMQSCLQNHFITNSYFIKCKDMKTFIITVVSPCPVNLYVWAKFYTVGQSFLPPVCMNETNTSFSAVYHSLMFTVEFAYLRTRSRKTWIRQQMVRGAAPLPFVSPATALIHHWFPLSLPLPPASTPLLRSYPRGWWLIRHLFSRQKQNLYAYKVSYVIFMWYSDNILCHFLRR